MFDKITTWIATTGTDPDFIAFNAHAGFAFAVVAFFPSWWTIGIGVIAAAVKEFYFDATYEVPKQTFIDNVTDFVGYCCGLLIATQKFLL